MAEIPDEMELTLRKPLITASGSVDVLKLREPTAGELDKLSINVAKHGGTGAVIHLIAAITGIDKPFIDKLGARDFTAANDYLMSFTNASPETGATE